MSSNSRRISSLSSLWEDFSPDPAASLDHHRSALESLAGEYLAGFRGIEAGTFRCPLPPRKTRLEIESLGGQWIFSFARDPLSGMEEPRFARLLHAQGAWQENAVNLRLCFELDPQLARGPKTRTLQIETVLDRNPGALRAVERARDRPSHLLWAHLIRLP